MGTVGLRELRQDASDLVRRAEAGEEIIITVSGRPSARLVAARSTRWRAWSDIEELFQGHDDPEWSQERDLLDDDTGNPWTER